MNKGDYPALQISDPRERWRVEARDEAESERSDEGTVKQL